MSSFNAENNRFSEFYFPPVELFFKGVKEIFLSTLV